MENEQVQQKKITKMKNGGSEISSQTGSSVTNCIRDKNYGSSTTCKVQVVEVTTTRRSSWVLVKLTNTSLSVKFSSDKQIVFDNKSYDSG